jgi:hypothetical protein
MKMKTTKILTILVLALCLTVCLAQVSEAASLSDAFTYQGRLIDANNAADGLYDFQFRLFDDPNVVDGNQVGSDVNKPDVDAIDGYFTVELDFGSTVFNGDARWLEIGVRPGVENDPCGYTPLSPLQEVTAVPYALQTRGIFVDDALKVGIGATNPNWRLTIEEGGLNVFAGGSGETVGFSTSRFYVANNNEDSLMDIRESPSDLIRFSNNGGEVMTIIDEKVGIGTQSPVGKLHVESSGQKTVFGKNTASSGKGVHGLASDFSGGGCGVYGESYGTTGFGVFGIAAMTTGINYGVYGQSQSPEGWAGYFNGRGYFSSNVGIGTTNPTAKLEVAGDAKITGSLFAGSGPTVLFVDDTSDMVGIGTTSPRTQLEILGTTGLRVTTGDHTNVYGDFKHAYSGGLIINANAGGGGFADMSFQTNATTKMFIESSGNVGIGTSSPVTKLQIEGGTDASLTGNGFIVNGSLTSTNMVIDNNAIIVRDNGAAAKLHLNNGSGNVVVGVLEITGGSDLAEPFKIAGDETVKPGMVMAIDAEHPGQLRVSDKAYDRTVAGIVSGANGINPGMTMRQEDTLANGSTLVALTGRVYCYADASCGAIEPGDLLTTSERPGHAMKVTDHSRAHGAILGKAMSSLDQGTGLVLVLVTLQ